MRNAEKKAARQKPLKEGLQRPFASLDRWLAKNKYITEKTELKKRFDAFFIKHFPYIFRNGQYIIVQNGKIHKSFF